jgi:methyl-accepting chemotaxis protein
MIRRELERQGILAARMLAHETWQALESDQTPALDPHITGSPLSDDIMYLSIVSNNGESILSSIFHQHSNVGLLPDVPLHACDPPDADLSANILLDERITIVSVPILPSSLISGSRTRISQLCRGTLHIGLTLDRIDQQISGILLLVAGAGIAALCIVVIGYRGVLRMCITPLNRMTELTTRFSQRDFQESEATVAEHVHGDLELALENMFHTYQSMLSRVNTACGHMQEAADELLALSEEFSSTSQRQTASIEHLSQTIEVSRGVSHTMAEHSERADRAVETTLQSTNHIKQAVTQTIENIQEICNQADRNSERMGQLSEKISQIGTVVKMINTIADQTRMIAFNASIEAAGAGEAGGRFSIVATEVRRLANTVVESLEEIRELVSSIQSATSELALSSETGVRKVNQGVNLITETGDTLQHILEMIDTTAQSVCGVSAAIQQQQNGYRTMAKDVADMTDEAQYAATMSTQTSAIAQKIRQIAQQLDIT